MSEVMDIMLKIGVTEEVTAAFSGRCRTGERMRQLFGLAQHLFHKGGDAAKRESASPWAALASASLARS